MDATPLPPASSSSAASAPPDAPTATRREFVAALKAELPVALANLQRGNIAPVDLAQAAIGPGMAVYTRYAKVLDAQGKPLTVREALALINADPRRGARRAGGRLRRRHPLGARLVRAVGLRRGRVRRRRDALARPRTRASPAWSEAGILESGRGKVRLLRPEELPADWDPATDPRLTAWEIVHHLIRVIGSGGEGAAAELVAKLGARAEVARELAYRLYTLCERKKRAGRCARLQRPDPELARDHPPRPGGRQARGRPGRPVRRHGGIGHGHHEPGTRRQGHGPAPRRACPLRRARVREPAPGAGGRHGAPPSRRRPAGGPQADRGLGRGGAPAPHVGLVERRVRADPRPRRALARPGAARRPQQVGAPGAVLERRRRPGARLDRPPPDRRLGARRPTRSAR